MSSGSNIYTTASKHWLLRLTLIVIINAIALLWLYSQTKVVSNNQHINFIQKMRYINKVDSLIDKEILANYTRFSKNYDALTFYNRLATTKLNAIKSLPSFLSKVEHKKLQEELDVFTKTAHFKSDLIDLFKRNNSILINSRNYFVSASEKLLAKNKLNNSFDKILNNYIHQTLLYIQNYQAEHFKKSHLLHTQLLTQAHNIYNTKKILSLLEHGAITITSTEKVSQQIRAISALPISDSYHKIIAIYNKSYLIAQRHAQKYHKILVAYSILLVLFVSYLLINLINIRQLLTKSYDELKNRYIQQQETEKLLVLHDTAFFSAHEAMTLTDANGIIIDVNPSFSRITGYTRDEAIGHNPSMLKSGKHTEQFYQAMWYSINSIGRWQGEIWNRKKSGEIFPENLSITAVKNNDDQVVNYVAVFSDTSQFKEQERQLKQMAYYDALTKLPNRFLLTDRITQAISQTQRTNTYMAICFLDFDGFKPINDTYGHDAGDRLLIEMANRFENILRKGDTVARIGGDEFVFLLVGMSKIKEHELAIKRILRTIAQPMTFNEDIISLTASIGVTISPCDDKDADTLLRHADQAMYKAKQKGKNCYYLFNTKESDHVQVTAQKIKRIEQALLEKELVLFYQPKVDLRSGTVFGLEALIRWQHPQNGLVPPNDFLPLIEDHELIERIGDWVIETTLQQMTYWLADGIELEVSVNVSSRQLQQGDFVESLKTLLEKYPKVNPKNLEMEVLETAALEDIINIASIIEQCHKFGVGFALDDFGTGYSSLIYLKRLPAKTLKIDLSFVQKILVEPSDFSIVQGILGLASAFQNRSIAEGVETLDHALILLQLGCQYVQGYGISKPMPSNDVKHWIEQWQLPQQWQQYQKLYWDDTDYPIFLAQIEHRYWVDIIVDSVMQQKPIILLNITDHHHCNFGKWYDNIGQHKYHQFESFKLVEQSHIAVHKAAELIETSIQKGQFSEAKQQLNNLIQQRDEVIKHLTILAMDVAHKL